MAAQTTQTGASRARTRRGRLAHFLTVVHPQRRPPVRINRRLVVGRSCAGVSLDDHRSSREHFEVLVVYDGYALQVRDLGSKNGTWFNGQRVESEYTPEGGVVRAGDTLCVLSSVPEPAPRPRRGLSAAWTRVEARVEALAPMSLSVLLTGPTGSGKGHLARALHELSGRPGRLVSLNCATLAPTLIASELFGHVRGAFSGAEASRDGLFVRADGGTLFLDEIADLPLDLQPALLRALEDGCVRPVGSDAPRAVNVRVVAASHREGLIEDPQRFRPDLLGRLTGERVEVPSLAQRREDVLPMLAQFLGRPLDLDVDAAEALLAHDWPFNLRGLKHLAESLSEQLGPLRRAHLPEAFQGAPDPLSPEGLRAGLARHAGKVARLAAELGESRQKLYRRIEAFKIDPEQYR